MLTVPRAVRRLHAASVMPRSKKCPRIVSANYVSTATVAVAQRAEAISQKLAAGGQAFTFDRQQSFRQRNRSGRASQLLNPA
jgi:hypothetical protein